VSEKTGYPPDMLDPDLDLEADLGIDTVKQAEVFATIREAYDIPRREDLKLRDYNTLDKVVGFVYEMRPDLKESVTVGAPAGERKTEAEPVTVPQPVPIQGKRPIVSDLAAARNIPRRVPLPFLRPSLDLCRPTGFEFAPDKRVIVVSDAGKTAKYLGYRLRARKVKALILKEATPETAAAQVATWLEEGPIAGVYFMPGLDAAPSLTDMNLAQWRAEQDKRIKTLYTVMHALPAERFLISATRMGGLHGFGQGGAANPLGGALTGFTKAYAMECREALVKAIDFESDIDEREIAEILIDETLSDPGAVEIGHYAGQRFNISVVKQNVDDTQFDIELGRETVFLITGGAGGISVPIVTDLATASSGVFYLTDRTEAPDPNDPDLARLETDLKFLKRDIAKRIQDAGDRPTPVKVERELAKLGRQKTIVDLMSIIKQAGGTAYYRDCDVTDADTVADLVNEIQQTSGKLDVIIHAAGLERSHPLADKPPSEFNLVYDVKVDGLFCLLKGCEQLHQPPQAVVVYSSIAGRFGNLAQTDYSAANDLMSKIVSSLNAAHPETKYVAIDWTAWAGVGMATRGSIPEMMQRAGIEMIQPEHAAPVVRREISVAGTGGEVLIAQTLGILADPRAPENGLDLECANAKIAHDFPVAGRVTGLDVFGTFAFETELDPQQESFLYDHAIDNMPLLPGVMGVEGFAEVACLSASKLGGKAFRIASISDVRFEAPFKFYRQQPRTLTWRVMVVPEGQGLVAHVQLESTREIKSGQEHTKHFYGRVHLEPTSDQETAPQTVEAPVWDGTTTVKPDDIYRIYFHGPAFQVLEGVCASGAAGARQVLGKFSDSLQQIDNVLIPPLLVELCLQTAGVWEIGKTGVMALPAAIEQVIVHRLDLNGGPLYADMVPREGDEMVFDGRVLDTQGNVYIEMQGYHTTPFSKLGEESLLAPLRQVVQD
ncbi:MAG: SDR family NAD(P)-dependent oxidoreductase, partial [Anaerolineae bacterium]|nr:SDR family NAD(P)-dependent oxidoreductase [Anaerolineae bacterium]